jgi:hypothetical protein
MTIFSTRVTVGTAAVQVVPPGSSPVKVQFINAGTAVVRIGGPDVSSTAAFGLPRLPADPNAARTVFDFTLNPGEDIWAVVASGTSDLNVWYQRTD